MKCLLLSVVLLQTYLLSAEKLSYESIVKLNANCSILDTCRHDSFRKRYLDSLKERNCACDQKCAIYGDCCIDAKSQPEMSAARQHWDCTEMRQIGDVYMRSKCPSQYGNEVVKRKCENDSLVADPITLLPVTSIYTEITYKNVYCAQCNSDVKNITFWNARLECSGVKEYNSTFKNLTNSFVEQNLVYFAESDRWGINLDYPYMCDIDPVFPDKLQHILRFCKSRFVDDCPPKWKDKKVRDACRSYQAVVFGVGSTRFWNVHCAFCNGYVSNAHSRLICKPIEGRDKESNLNSRSSFNPSAFSVLFDFNAHSSGSDVVGERMMCSSEYQVFDPFSKRCRAIICSNDDYVLIDGECIRYFPEKSTEKDEERNVTGISFHNCPKLIIEENEYYLLHNKSIYIKKYDKIFVYWSYASNNKSVLICSPFLSSSYSKFSMNLGIATAIGLGISVISLLLHLFVFCCVPELQNLSGLNLSSFCLSLMLAYCCFILSQWSYIQKVTVYCEAFAIATYFFFILSFQWMSVMAFDVWKTLRMATTQLRVATGTQKFRFTVYTFYSVITAAIIVICAVVCDYSPNMIPISYRPGFGLKQKCWFTRRKSLTIFFAAPTAVVLISNVLFFILTARIITKSSVVSTTKLKSCQQSERHNFKLYIRLSLLMGLSWTTAFLASLIDNSYLWYAFVILNSLHGLFIFISFSCNKKVYNLLQNKYSKGKSLTSSSNLTASSKRYTSQSSLSTASNQAKMYDANVRSFANSRFPSTFKL